MHRLWLLLLVLLLATPAVAANGAWEPATIVAGTGTQYTFTGLTDSTTHLDARQCGTVSLGFEQDMTLGGGTTGAATIYSCPTPTSTPISGCSVVTSLGTGNSLGATYEVRPGYLAVDVTGDPTGTSRITAYCGDNTFSGGGGGGTHTVTVCDHGCDATRICGIDCTSGSPQTCVAGSAVALALAKNPNVVNPVTIDVGPGRYNECVNLNSITYTTLRLMGGAQLRPTVTASTSVAGGVLRIGTDGGTRTANNLTIVVDAGASVQNDAFSSPEAAIQLNTENGGVGVASWDMVKIIVDGKVIGHHDGIQWVGDNTSGAGTANLPRLWISGNGEVISGRDALAEKGQAIDTITGIKVYSWDDYCVDSQAGTGIDGATKYALVTGGVQAGSDDGSAGVILAAGSLYGADGGYVHRKITFSDADGGGAGVCGAGNADDGQISWVTSYTNSTNSVILSPILPVAATTGCNYSLAAVPNYDKSPCTDIDWARISTGAGSNAYWKQTGYHFGIVGVAAASTNENTIVKDVKITVNTNMATLNTGTCAAGQAMAACVLSRESVNWNTAEFDNVDCEVNMNYDQRDISCVSPIGGLMYSGAAEMAGLIWKAGSITVNNTGDDDENVSAVIGNSTSAGTITLAGDVHLDVNNTVGSYTGTTQTILATSPTVVQVAGGISSPDLITVATAANITGWNEKCITIPTGAGTAFVNMPIPWTDSLVGIRPWAAACRCQGTCGAAETSLLLDFNGDTIATLTCQDTTNALSYADVTGDADFDDTGVGQSLLVNEGTLSGTAGDNLEVCVRGTSHIWPQ